MQSEKILELKELHISFTQYTRGLQRRTIENVCGLSFSTYAGEVTAPCRCERVVKKSAGTCRDGASSL